MKGLFLMSGGTTPVINATLAGVLSSLTKKNGLNNKVFTAKNGIKGVIDGEFSEISNEIDFIKFAYKEPGSAITGTSRVGFLNEKKLQLIEYQLKKMKFDFVINVGGNGTLQQSRVLAKWLQDKYSIGNCPKTVDNDLGDNEMEEVFYTPGFPSCINWWNKMISLFNIENIGASSHDKVLVLQTFGRETGFISGAVGLNTEFEEYIINMIPESKSSKDFYLSKINQNIDIYGRCIVIISEGHFSNELDHNLDPAGQIQFSGSKSTSAQLLVEYLIKQGINSRSIIPGTMQRVFKNEVLEFDRELAFAQGYECMEQIKSGNRNFLVSISKNCQNEGPILSNINFSDKNLYSRTMPKQFINDFQSSQKYKEYLKQINLYKDIYKDFVQSKLNFEND